ncbi:hypothetical protein MAL08_14770 [Leptospira noguchii]|uniref:Uncharacterized protein n=1 Tax=Leptospira noguchii serovar Autumnalis str. ZUN142 TaxID=1085540 RepID=M6UD10_9LEPT|nr:hypothetical protein [Leptospira noguchii]EMO42445.1 hypothetical protein LEP1GSC186_1606 [Leptospira noguchii serovar Autumnalis str. ZUN142]UOG37305.1 hypothetical protein MAL08_14770 [Leptospira noguchii]
MKQEPLPLPHHKPYKLKKNLSELRQILCKKIGPALVLGGNSGGKG